MGQLSAGRKRQDTDGRRAARGPIDEVLQELLRHPYFAQPPPKSCGREEFGNFAARAWTTEVSEERPLRDRDRADGRVGGPGAGSIRAHRVLVSGGGVHNHTLMRELARRLPRSLVQPLEEHGYSSDSKEALAFAIPGHAAWHGRPANVPACTGATRPVILGQIAPGRNYAALRAEL